MAQFAAAAASAPPASLIPASDHLREALASIEQASRDFAQPDAGVRQRGEATFLALRHSEGAVEYACFALEHSHDAFVLFQSFNIILSALPTLPLHSPTPSVTSLDALLAFLFSIALSRHQDSERVGGSSSATASAWKPYVRSRSHQCCAAVLKRLLGLEAAAAKLAAGEAAALAAVQNRLGQLYAQLDSLLTLPDAWPSGQPAHEAELCAPVVTALGVAGAVVDEFGLRPAANADESAHARDGGSTKGKQVASEPGSAVGLSLLEHRWCKAAVQTYLLPPLMARTLQLLYECGPTQPRAKAGVHLSSPLIALLERLLSWPFLLREPFAGLLGQEVDDEAALWESDASGAVDGPGTSLAARITTAQPVPADFEELLLGSDLPALLADALSHRARRALETGSSWQGVDVDTHRLRQCLLTVASYRPAVPAAPSHAPPSLDDRQLQRAYTLRATLETLVSIQVGAATASSSQRGASLFFLATAFGTFLSSLPPSQLCRSCHVTAVDAGHLPALLQSLSTLSTLSLQFALGTDAASSSLRTSGEMDGGDDVARLAEECLDGVVGLWTALLGAVQAELLLDRFPDAEARSAVGLLHRALLAHVRTDLVRPYVEGRLARAEAEAGGGGGAAGEVETEMSELGEESGKDRDVYSEQLVAIAALARNDADDCLRHLEALAQPLIQAVTSVAQHGLPAAGGVDADAAQRRLEGKWEALHWLTLMAGHVLADEPRGETAGVPDEVLAVAPGGDGEHAALTLISQLGLVVLHALSICDPSRPSSPQVTETLLWFNARWVGGYLLSEAVAEGRGAGADGARPASAVVRAKFGPPALGGQGPSVLAFLVSLLRSNLERWLGDADVVQQVAAVLASMARSRGIASHLLGLDDFRALVDAVVGGLDALPASTHRPLISALVSCFFGAPPPPPPEASAADPTGSGSEPYFARLTAAVESRLGSVLLREDLDSLAQQASTASSVLTSLEMLEGLAGSAQPSSARHVFGVVSRYLDALARLVGAFRLQPEVATAVLRVVATLAKSLDLGFSGDDDVVAALNAACSRLFAEVGTHPDAVARRNDASALEEEVPYEALCLALELLVELRAASGFGSAAQPPLPQQVAAWLSAQTSSSETADVCLVGLGTLLPLVDGPPLTVPRVRRALGSATAELAAAYAPRLVGLAAAGATSGAARPAALLESVVAALDVCFGADESDAALSALEAVVPLAAALPTIVSALQGANHGAAAAAARLVAAPLSVLLAHVLQSMLFEALDSRLVGAHLVACRALMLALAGDDDDAAALRSALESFRAMCPLREKRGRRRGYDDDEGAAGSRRAVAPADEASRRGALAELLGELANAALASRDEGGGGGFAATTAMTPLQARARAKEEAQRTAAFCARTKGTVSRARAAFRVR